MMISGLLRRLRDMRTIATLIAGADRYSNAMGETKPGAEHFVLSALALNDGTASHALGQFGVDATAFKAAIRMQYQQALGSLGIDGDTVLDQAEPATAPKLHESQASGQQLIQSLHALKQKDARTPLQSAHVLIVAAAMEYGVVPRSLKLLGIERSALTQAAKQALVLTA